MFYTIRRGRASRKVNSSGRMCYNMWVYFFKGITLWVNYGHIIGKLWAHCRQIMGTLLANYGHIVEKLWAHYRQIMDTL